MVQETFPLPGIVSQSKKFQTANKELSFLHGVCLQNLSAVLLSCYQGAKETGQFKAKRPVMKVRIYIYITQ